MKAIECLNYGGPEVLYLSEHKEPQIGVGEVGIAVSASGINRPDLLQRKGLYAPPDGVSTVLGLEVAGTIEQGDGDGLKAAGFKIGDRVCALLAGGGYAQKCVVPITQCLPIPNGLSDIEAAALPETFFTVWSNLVDLAHFEKGQSILIHGGSSGIGVVAIQMAKHVLGASQIIITAGTAKKCQACLTLGADIAVNYHQQDFVAEIKKITKGLGVDVVLDMIAGSYTQRNIDALAMDGKLLLIAVQGGVISEVNMAKVLTKRLQIIGSTLRTKSLDYKAKIASDLIRRIWPLLAVPGIIKPVIDTVFKVRGAVGEPCLAAIDAHQRMAGNAHVGKMVLDWSEL